MSRTKFKEYVEANNKKVDKKYEDYVAIKNKEQDEIQDIANLMETEVQWDSDVVWTSNMDFVSKADSVTTSPEKPPNVLKLKKVKTTDPVQGESLQGLKTFASEISYAASIEISSNYENLSYEVGYSPAEVKLVAEQDSHPLHRSADVFFTPTKTKRGYGVPVKKSSAQFLNPSKKVIEEYSEIMPEVDSDATKNPTDIEMFSWVRDGFKIIRTAERTLIYAVVKSNDLTKNTAGQIKCCGGIAFGGYARDAANDTFLVECVEYVNLGSVPFGFRLEMPNCGSWYTEIPIPEKVLDKALTPTQRKVLSDLYEKYPSETHEVFFLQLSVSN